MYRIVTTSPTVFSGVIGDALDSARFGTEREARDAADRAREEAIAQGWDENVEPIVLNVVEA